MNRLQHGFTLVELMISLLLGSLIVIAAVELFSTNQKTFELQQAVSDVQESGRFTLDYMVRDLRKAGLENGAGDPSAGVITPNIPPKGSYSSAPPVSQDDSVLGGNFDRLSFEFYGTTDCEGDTAGSTQLIVDTYEVRSVGGDNALYCEGTVDSGTTGAELLPGVDCFEVLYGLDSSINGSSSKQDGIPFAGIYKKANQIAAGENIVSVRVGLLVHTQRDNVGKLGSIQGFTVLDKVLAAGTAPLDVQRVRRLFTATVKVRNFNWGKI